MRRGVALQQRRAQARAYASSVRAKRAGLPPETVRVAMLLAYQAWSARLPWRFLPDAVRWLAFAHVGRQFAGRFVAGYTDG